jgi:hypothetical protein
MGEKFVVDLLVAVLKKFFESYSEKIHGASRIIK